MTSSSGPRPRSNAWPAEAVVRDDGRPRRLRRGGAAEVPLGREDRPRAYAGQLLRHRRRREPRAVGNEQIGNELGLKPRARILATAVTGTEPTIMLTGPAPATEGAREGGPDDRRHRPDRDQRGFRRGCAALRPDMAGRERERAAGEGQRQRRRDRDGSPARRDRRHDPRDADRRASSDRRRYGLATLCVGGGMGIATIVEAI